MIEQQLSFESTEKALNKLYLDYKQSCPEHASRFMHVIAVILNIVHDKPGLTYQQIAREFLRRKNYLPRIGNRIRDLRRVGLVKTVKEEDGLLHVYPKKEPEEL